MFISDYLIRSVLQEPTTTMRAILSSGTSPYAWSTMSVSRPPEIKCLFFCEFHPTAGPKIVHQVRTKSLVLSLVVWGGRAPLSEQGGTLLNRLLESDLANLNCNALRLGMRDDCFIVQNVMHNKLSGVIQ